MSACYGVRYFVRPNTSEGCLLMNKNNSIKSGLLRNLISLCVMGLFTPAIMAQSAAPDEQTPVDQWRFTVGLGAAYQPKYPGSGDHQTRAFPVLSAGHGRYFIGGVPDTGIPLGIGAFLIQNQTWRVGVGVGHQLQAPRDESDSSRLNGLGDVDATTLGAIFASYNDTWFRVRGYISTDLANNDQGTRISLDLDGKYRVNDSLLLTAGPGMTWADSDYTQTFFGIDSAQSARSGRQQYSAGSGVNSIRFGIGANYRIDPQWAVSARYTAARLQGDAKDSPITEKRSQNTFTVMTTYNF